MRSTDVVKQYMDEQITKLKLGKENLEMHTDQPERIGNLYNGMLKSMVDFEITHMQHMEKELLSRLYEVDK